MNHLSEIEIQEAVRTGQLTPKQQEHITKCSSCAGEYEKMKKLFAMIKSVEVKAPERDLWQGIAHRKLQSSQKSHKLKNWSIVSLAASLFIVIGIQWHGMNEQQFQQNQLQALMLQSQMLEKRLSENQQLTTTSSIAMLTLQQQLNEVDVELQNAYLNSVNATQIQTLWEKRIRILQQIQSLSVVDESIEII